MTKIDLITNQRTQLFFERTSVNFKGVRKKRERKEKKKNNYNPTGFPP